MFQSDVSRLGVHYLFQQNIYVMVWCLIQVAFPGAKSTDVKEGLGSF